jgi:hypothetical protein
MKIFSKLLGKLQEKVLNFQTLKMFFRKIAIEETVLASKLATEKQSAES